MDWISKLLQAFFDQTNVLPEHITELEIVPGAILGQYWIHVQPKYSWYAEVNYLADQWCVAQYDYL